MKTVTNKTKKPLRISLPGGRTLFLGVTQRAPLRDDALNHPAVKKLIEAGDIEVFDGGAVQHGSAGGGFSKGANPGHNSHNGKATNGDR